MSTEFALNLFQFGDIAGNGQWLVGHFRQHLRYNAVLAARTPAVLIPEFPILSVEAGQVGRRDWLDSHDSWHRLIRPFTVVTGINLAEVNLDDENQFYAWMELHNQEHSLFDLSLGVQ